VNSAVSKPKITFKRPSAPPAIVVTNKKATRRRLQIQLRDTRVHLFNAGALNKGKQGPQCRQKLVPNKEGLLTSLLDYVLPHLLPRCLAAIVQREEADTPN